MGTNGLKSFVAVQFVISIKSVRKNIKNRMSGVKWVNQYLEVKDKFGVKVESQSSSYSPGIVSCRLPYHLVWKFNLSATYEEFIGNYFVNQKSETFRTGYR